MSRSVLASASWLGVAIALVGCGNSARESTAAHTAIGGDVVARVGDVGLPASLVGAVAAEHHISAAAALNLLIDDAVAAKGAEARRLGESPEVRFAHVSTLGRATIDRIRSEARATPPTDEEVRILTARHWIEVDSPETFEVVHAVVLRPKKPDAAAEAAAKAVAAAIVTATSAASGPDDFMARARAVPHGGSEVTVEALQPFTADGRIASPGSSGGYHTEFTAGAAALPSPGATSGVVESPSGWHVIRLVARHAAISVPFEERRRMFAPEAYAHRARQALDALEAKLREREPVQIANGVDDILEEASGAARSSAEDTAAP